MNKFHDWTQFRDSSVYTKILKDWENLLNDTSKKEQDYHSFLQSNPAIFLTVIESYIVISKLKLGNEFETDFVVVKEGYSEGTNYDIIEIESPHTTLFDSKGKPSAKFNAAIQQIRDWRRWLIENKNGFKRILPTVGTRVLKDSKLNFKIIIGRRSENPLELEKRRQISEEMNIEIISFDRLTDLAKYRRKFINETTIFSGQMDFDIDDMKKNQLANPFYECIKHSEWRKICNNVSSHIHTNLIDKIIETRTYNKYFEEYKNIASNNHE